MFRLWCKLFDDSNHLLKDMVVENDDAKSNSRDDDGRKEQKIIKIGRAHV